MIQLTDEKKNYSQSDSTLHLFTIFLRPHIHPRSQYSQEHHGVCILNTKYIQYF